jgi:RimJ/RimL family protein N-acetyltransferase
MQKLGMTLEGVHRQSLKKWDKFEDAAQYSILRSEWGLRDPDPPHA